MSRNYRARLAEREAFWRAMEATAIAQVIEKQNLEARRVRREEGFEFMRIRDAERAVAVNDWAHQQTKRRMR